jgi:hypothetical protein
MLGIHVLNRRVDPDIFVMLVQICPFQETRSTKILMPVQKEPFWKHEEKDTWSTVTVLTPSVNILHS